MHWHTLAIPRLKKTERFVHYFNKFFDCLNISEWKTSHKPERKPYTSPNDTQLDVGLNFVCVYELVGHTLIMQNTLNTPNLSFSSPLLSFVVVSEGFLDVQTKCPSR